MGIFSSIFSKRIQLLKVEFEFMDNLAKVEVERLNPETKDIEFVYLFIYHFAKTLFMCPSDFAEKEILFQGLRDFEQNDDTINFLTDMDTSLVSSFDESIGDRQFVSILKYKDNYSRILTSTIPTKITGIDATRTIILLAKEAFKNCSSLESNVLKTAIQYQTSLYSQGLNPRTMRSLIQTPIDVFQFAIRNRDVNKDINLS